MICVDFNFATDTDILNKEKLSWTYANLLVIMLRLLYLWFGR
jgi:hypothetical protein